MRNDRLKMADWSGRLEFAFAPNFDRTLKRLLPIHPNPLVDCVATLDVIEQLLTHSSYHIVV